MTAAKMREQVALYAAQFPTPGCCTAEGRLCAGGDLLPARLLAAYSRGIFPWYGEDMPLLWWCPDPRCVLPLDAFQLPRRSARALRNHPFELPKTISVFFLFPSMTKRRTNIIPM